MRIAFFSTKPYDQRFFEAANEGLAETGEPGTAHELGFYETRLTSETVSMV